MSTMIAGCGFARMAWELAKWRKLPQLNMLPYEPPAERAQADAHPHDYKASREYFRILDNAWYAWTTDKVFHSHGLVYSPVRL